MKRKHLALLVPNTDTTLESDMKQGLSVEWIYHSYRMFLEEVGENAERIMVDQELPKGLSAFKGIIDFSGVIFGCTSASAVYGRSGLSRLLDTMSRELNCPSYSAFSGIKDGIEVRGNPPLALITPYVHEVNSFFKTTLNDFAVNVIYENGLGILKDPQIAACSPDIIKEFVLKQKKAIKDSGAKMILLSCTNWRTMEVRKELENEMEMPIITSNQCLIEWVNNL